MCACAHTEGIYKVQNHQLFQDYGAVEAGEVPRRNAMKARFLTLLITLVFLGFSVTAIAKGKPVEPTVLYNVALTTGVYTFSHEATLNSRGYLKSYGTDTLVIGPPVGIEEQEAWNAVIDSCGGPLLGNFSEGHDMHVNFDDWAVGRNGDDGILWINFENIRLPNDGVPQKEIQIQLRLKDRPDITKTFLPTEVGEDLTFPLNSYVVWGKPLGGKGKNKGWDTCYDDPDMAFLPAKLVIKYIRVL